MTHRITPSNHAAGTSRKRRRQEKLWARNALRNDEYVEMLEDKARRRKKLPEVSEREKEDYAAWLTFSIA